MKTFRIKIHFVQSVKKKLMVFIVAASSVDHALETLNPENRKNYNERVYSLPGLSLNVNTKKPEKDRSKLAL